MKDPFSGNRISPELQATYRNEFARGIKLFEESLTAYENTPPDEVIKKAKFKDVMDKALKIMNESARGFLSESGKSEESKLEKDYQAFLANDNKDSYNKLNKDIRHLKEYT